jgi:hypothetical protein
MSIFILISYLFVPLIDKNLALWQKVWKIKSFYGLFGSGFNFFEILGISGVYSRN